MEHYKDKVAIVTGGASGIGRVLCEELGRRGADVVVADINMEGAQRTASAITAAGGKAKAARLDVTKAEDVRRLIQETASTHGRLDFMFNNAGIAVIGEMRDMDMDQWHRIIDVNLKGVIYGTTAAYQLMVKQGFGHIVNTASVAGLFPAPLETSYATTKYGVVGLSTTLRMEAAGLGVKVSAVCPGFIRTEIFDNTPVLKAPREEAIAIIPPSMIGDVSRVARKILRGVARNKAVIVFPFSYRILRLIYWLSPSMFEYFSRRFISDFRTLRKDH
mgnify:CR=1 FL=1